MREERLRILRMIEEGQLSAEEGSKLLQALEVGTRRQPRPAAPGGPVPVRWFRVRVTDLESGRQQATANIPVSLITVGLRIASRFMPEIAGVRAEAVLAAIHAGHTGKIIDVSDAAEGERVEIYIE